MSSENAWLFVRDDVPYHRRLLAPALEARRDRIVWEDHSHDQQAPLPEELTKSKPVKKGDEESSGTSDDAEEISTRDEAGVGESEEAVGRRRGGKRGGVF